MVICRQLNMEEAVEEIMQQLGADVNGRISFDEFVGCRMRLISEIEHEKMRERGIVPGLPGAIGGHVMDMSSHMHTTTGSNISWGSAGGDNIQGGSHKPTLMIIYIIINIVKHKTVEKEQFM